MSTPTRVSHPIYSLLPTEVEGFDSLAELALDMRSSWNYATDQVWRQLDPVLWELTHNPWMVLQTVSRDQIERVLAKCRGWMCGSTRHAPLGGERHERHEGARHNGGINLSELDGWWAEAYTPEVGWTLGDGQEHVSQAPAARGVS